MNYYRYIIFIVLALFLQLAVFSVYVTSFDLNIIVPIVFFIALYAPLELALVFSATLGFIFDISTLRILPFFTVFLLLELVGIILAKRRIIDFSNIITRVISISVVIIIFEAIKSSIFYRGFGLSLFYSTIANILLAILIIELLNNFKKKLFNL